MANVDVIEQDIRRSRRALEANLTELHAKVDAAANWKAHYSAHMGTVLGAALLGGVILGAVTNGKRRSSVGTGAIGQAASRAADALVTVALDAAVAFVGDLIPGFADDFRRSSQRGAEYPRA